MDHTAAAAGAERSGRGCGRRDTRRRLPHKSPGARPSLTDGRRARPIRGAASASGGGSEAAGGRGLAERGWWWWRRGRGPGGREPRGGGSRREPVSE